MRKKKRRPNRAERHRGQMGTYVGVAVLSALCLGAIVMISTLNSVPVGGRHVSTTTSDIWYVENEDVEIAAAQAESAPETAMPEATVQPTPTPEATEAATPAVTQIRKGVAPPTPDPTRAPATITITATGDCTLGTYTTREGKRSNFKAYVEKYGYDYFLQNVRELFSEDDLTIVNLEGPLCNTSEKRPGRTFNFRGYPDYTNILTSGSVEICNLANNHALDYGKQGFQETCEALEAAGIGYSGYGPEYYTEVNGYTVGSLGFTEWNFEEKDILSAVEAAAKKCDLLIVSMHWGKERHAEMSSYARKMGRALIDAGADLVIGNHAHIYGEIEKYNGKYIINTLGNFCFGGNDDPQIHDCAIFRQRFLMTEDGAADGGIDIIPALISSTEEYNDFQPKIADPTEGARMLAEIKSYSPTLTAESVIWLEDSYAVRNGLLTGDIQTAQPQETVSDAAQQTPEPQETTMDATAQPEMEIAQDIAR